MEIAKDLWTCTEASTRVSYRIYDVDIDVVVVVVAAAAAADVGANIIFFDFIRMAGEEKRR